MTKLNSKKILFFFLILILGSYPAIAQNENDFDIRGAITKLNRAKSGEMKSNKLLGSILIERDANGSGKHDKADVKITNESRIYAQTDQGKNSPLRFEALELNQRVEVRFATAPALLTYPIQVAASEIIILSDLAGISSKSGNSVQNNSPQTSDSEMTKVRRAIDAGNAIWVEAWAKGDAALLPGTFTGDGKELVSGGKVYKGRKQILALMRDSMQKRGGKAKLTVTTTDVWLDGDTAFETGTAVYEFSVGGQPQILQRRYFTVWKRQSKRGIWKIYSNTGIAKE